MNLLTRHAVLILAWAALDVAFVGAMWRYGVVADRAIATRQWLAHRLRARLPRDAHRRRRRA
jgi:hypothetical protein